jgi:hypothetical protein
MAAGSLGLCQSGLAGQGFFARGSSSSSDAFCRWKNVDGRKSAGRIPSCSRRRVRVMAMVAMVENSPEAALVEALIGVQGRGRSASKQQLQVCPNSWQFGTCDVSKLYFSS